MNEDKIRKTIDDLMESNIEKGQRMLDEGASEAAKNVLALTTKLKDATLSEQALAALRKLPSTGHIRREKDIMVVRAVSQIIDEILASDPRKGEIIQLLDDVLARID